MLCRNKRACKPRKVARWTTYLAPPMSPTTNLYPHPRRHPSELRVEFLHSNTHAARASVIRARAEPARSRCRSLAPVLGPFRFFGRTTHAHGRARHYRCERLRRWRGWVVVKLCARVCLVVRNDESFRCRKRGRHGEV